MNSKSEYDIVAAGWFLRYVSANYEALGDQDIYSPLWSLIALACEIRFGGDPGEIPGKFEKIDHFRTIYIKERGFPEKLVNEVADTAILFAQGKPLPDNSETRIHLDLQSKVSYLKKKSK